MNRTMKPAQHYVLLFQSLRERHRAYVFPCDARGVVDMDELTGSALNDYLYARAVVGAEFASPCVQQARS